MWQFPSVTKASTIKIPVTYSYTLTPSKDPQKPCEFTIALYSEGVWGGVVVKALRY